MEIKFKYIFSTLSRLGWEGIRKGKNFKQYLKDASESIVLQSYEFKGKSVEIYFCDKYQDYLLGLFIFFRLKNEEKLMQKCLKYFGRTLGG